MGKFLDAGKKVFKSTVIVLFLENSDLSSNFSIPDSLHDFHGLIFGMIIGSM
jgi:hypothetical protein